MLDNLRFLRKERKLSQQKLAEELGISQQSINQYENHYIEPDIELLSRMADFFNTSLDYIVGRTDIVGKTDELMSFPMKTDEVEMLNRYRLLNEKEKACIDLILQKFSEK